MKEHRHEARRLRHRRRDLRRVRRPRLVVTGSLAGAPGFGAGGFVASIAFFICVLAKGMRT